MKQNNLGNYDTIYDVWSAYPEGGKEGDYLFIDGVKCVWDKYDNKWVPEVSDEDKTLESFYGEVDIHKGLHVGEDVTVNGNLITKGAIISKKVSQPSCGLFSSVEALQKAYPKPYVGMWAAVGDAVPAPIYRCETIGVWTPTGNIGYADGPQGEKGDTGERGPQGPQGNSGYTGSAGELEVVNNLTQGGATAALSAEMGKELNAKLQNLGSTNMPISISVGSYRDNDGLTPIEDANRARTSVIARKDIIGMSLMPPAGYYMWVFQLDTNFQKVTNTNWIGGGTSPLLVDNLADDVVYITIAFKNSYAGDTAMDESHLSTLQQWVNSQLYVSAKINNWDYALQANGGVDGAIKVEGTHVIIKPSGFGIIFKGKRYYVANEDTTVTEPCDFDLGAYSNLYLCLDTSLLTNPNARNNLADVVVVRSDLRENDIPIAYRYMKEQVYLLGQFKDIYGGTGSGTSLTHESINNDILFAPDFYAYRRGKLLNDKMEGISWYKRFVIAHYTDIHNYYDLFGQGLKVMQDKANVVVNCGDDSRGITADDAATVKSDLAEMMGVVNKVNTLPYIPNVGNHDFTGLTKKEYFDIVCAGLTNVVWGDAESYRIYGYVDFAGSGYQGDYRVIVLDPCDYNDGQYTNPYYNAYVVFSQKQIDWLIATLEDAANKGLNVITTMHYSFGENSLPYGDELAKPDAFFCQDAFMIPDIIKALQNKGTLSKDYADAVGANHISINKDFAETNPLKYVCHLFGHIHSKNAYQCQKTDGEKYDMLMLGELSLAQNGAALSKTYRDVNTVNNISFSALAIDSEEQAIYRISYGAYKDYSDPTKDARVTKLGYRFDNL